MQLKSFSIISISLFVACQATNGFLNPSLLTATNTGFQLKSVDGKTSIGVPALGNIPSQDAVTAANDGIVTTLSKAAVIPNEAISEVVGGALSENVAQLPTNTATNDPSVAAASSTVAANGVQGCSVLPTVQISTPNGSVVETASGTENVEPPVNLGTILNQGSAIPANTTIAANTDNISPAVPNLSTLSDILASGLNSSGLNAEGVLRSMIDANNISFIGQLLGAVDGLNNSNINGNYFLQLLAYIFQYSGFSEASGSNLSSVIPAWKLNGTDLNVTTILESPTGLLGNSTGALSSANLSAILGSQQTLDNFTAIAGAQNISSVQQALPEINLLNLLFGGQANNISYIQQALAGNNLSSLISAFLAYLKDLNLPGLDLQHIFGSTDVNISNADAGPTFNWQGSNYNFDLEVDRTRFHDFYYKYFPETSAREFVKSVNITEFLLDPNKLKCFKMVSAPYIKAAQALDNTTQ